MSESGTGLWARAGAADKEIRRVAVRRASEVVLRVMVRRAPGWCRRGFGAKAPAPLDEGGREMVLFREGTRLPNWGERRTNMEERRAGLEPW